MRYRVEYLVSPADGLSVCHATEDDAGLELVELKARLAGVEVIKMFGAGGFQIRDLADNGQIVALETFDDPLAGFWPDADDQVIH